MPLCVLAVVASFGLGIKSAGDVHTVQVSSATDESVRGDLTGDGTVDAHDAIAILEIAQGYRTATPAELRADPNDNGYLTVDDAIRILRSLAAQ